MADEVGVRVVLSVCNSGTERARFTSAPNAAIGFPHVPGSGSVGYALTDGPGVPAGTFVAVRAGTHQCAETVPVSRLRVVPAGVRPLDAALWQVGLVASHGLEVGGYADGEPVTVVGTGLIGAMTYRIAMARGTREVRLIASSKAKEWAVPPPGPDSAIEFVLADVAGTADGRHRLVFDASGTPDGLAVAAAAAADGGRIVLLGSPRSPDGAVPVGELHRRGLSLVGAHIDTLPDLAAATGADLLAQYTDRYFGLLAAGRLSMADVATVFSPEQASQLYQRLTEDRALVLGAIQWEPHGERMPAASQRATVHEPARPVGMAVVGCGDIGAQNAEAITQVPGARLAACFDPNLQLANELASRLGASCPAGLDDLLRRPDVDAVLVATPHDTHEKLALAVLGAGKHLLLQKPLAADLPAARRIAAAAAQSTAATSVLMPGRYEPGYRRALRALRENRLGLPAGLFSTYLVDKPSSYYHGGYSRRWHSDWRLSKARSGGGVLIMNLLHHLDLAQSLLGVPANSVYAETAYSVRSAEIEDLASVTVRFGDAVATFIGAASVSGAPGEHMRIWGPSASCVVLPTYMLCERNSPDALRPPSAEAPAEDLAGPADPQVRAIQAFADAIRANREPDVTIKEALDVQALVSAAYQSAQTGLRVRPTDLLT